ncbi:MAG: sigma-70 family RNA polymerase sigma factor [Archangium sp.]|nr:sigma-70 family RNA polymerase sigma factor [Archangium sp.]
MDAPTTEDIELVTKARNGDVAAFESLVEQHRGRVYGLALRMLNSEDDAAEVLQDTFLSAYRNLTQLQTDAQFGSWVLKIAANNALMRLRHRKVTRAVEEPLDAPNFNERGSLLDAVSEFKDAEGEAMDNELRVAIEQATAKLGDEYREVFVLKDLEGLSYEEIAEITGASVPAIKSRLHRARLSLRSAIDAFYAERSP